MMAGVRNLVHVVWDNGGWEITGAQPAGTTYGVDLAAIARGAGFRHTATVEDLAAFRETFAQALAADEAWFIDARIDSGGAEHRRPIKNLVAIRDRFMEGILKCLP
jgi:thiamine pyrophosphate-dependent acetolactate synthase large subunit-like protein